MLPIPRVLVLGSCRVSRPLRNLHERGVIDYVNFDERIWFTHTSAAARQTIGILQGTTSVPNELRAAAFETHLELAEDMSDPKLTDVDVVVVEVCSLRRHTVRGYELNAHKVYGEAVTAGIEPRQLVQGNTAALPAEHPLKGLQVTNSTYDALLADLLDIQTSVGAPVLTVDHLYSELPDGAPVPEREKISSYLHQIAAENGLAFHPTKAAILKQGIDAALTDQNHYRPTFEPVVADLLYPLIAQLATKQSAY